MQKIFLGAISWGTVLGLSAATRFPEKFHAYVGVAQIVNWAPSDELWPTSGL